MEKIYGFQAKQDYDKILTRVKEVFRVFKKIDKADAREYVRDNTDVFINWAFKVEEYFAFIKELESEFNIPLKTQFYNDAPEFQDITNDDYSSLEGIAYYIYSVSKK